LEVRKQYQTKISNRFVVLENLNNSEGINKPWENIKGKIKTSTKDSLGLHELKHHKPRFEDECLGFSYQSSSTVVKAPCYKSEGRWFDPRWCQWNVSLT